jgi:hypothetical protein
MTVHEEIPIAGTYKFRLRAVCQYDGGGAPSFSSAWTSFINANVTNSSRTTAWRVKASTKTCEIQSNLPVGITGEIAIVNSITTTDHVTGSGIWVDRTNSDIQVRFKNGSADADLSGKSFRIVVKERKKRFDYWYIAVNTTPTAIYILYTENIMSSPYVYNSFSGTTFVNIETGRKTHELRRVSISGTDFSTQRTEYEELYLYDFLHPTENVITGGNTGDKLWSILEQYYTDNNALTGTEKPNDSGDPDYVAPVLDTSSETGCPNGAKTTTVRISNNDIMRIRALEITSGTTLMGPDLSDWQITLGAGAPYYNVPVTPGDPHTFVVSQGAGNFMKLGVSIEIAGTAPVVNPGKVTIVVTDDSGSQTFLAPTSTTQTVSTFVGTFVGITDISITR